MKASGPKNLEPVQAELVELINTGEMGKLFFSRHIQHVVSKKVSDRMQTAVTRFLVGSDAEVTDVALQMQIGFILVEIQEASS